MSLSIGIVGLPNVGKSTLFNALTRSQVLAANYPFATIEPNTGIVPIPDERLTELAKLYDTEKVIPATVTFVDIAGLVAGASKGEGLGNQFLANIRETDAIVHVVRAFEDNNITHVDGRVAPAEDIAVINTELILADIQTLDRHIQNLQKLAKTDPKARSESLALEQLHDWLNEGKPLSSLEYEPELIQGLHLLTAKPVLYVFNVDEATLSDRSRQQELQNLVTPAPAIFICAQLESELSTIDEAEARELLESVGQTEPGLHRLIKAGYSLLNLQSFLTAGPKEVRAWTISVGATAPEAAGVIHTDFERGFIAAEVVNYDDLIAAGTKSAAKALGKVRTEGKDYVMRNGDVVEFRFNV